jgi:hypothetical protein
MKSFRLDTESIDKFIESWPAIIFAAALCGLFAYLGVSSIAWRALLIVFGGLYFGYMLRGTLTQNMRAKYPNASCLSLLSIAMCSATLGVLARMTFPSVQNGYLDYTWLSICFASLLAFIVINRRDPDVMQ